MKLIKYFLTIFCFTGIFSCTHNPLEVDVSNIDAKLSFKNFETDLLNVDTIDNVVIKEMRLDYGVFFDVFCSRILRLPANNDTIVIRELNRFKSDADIRDIYAEVNKVFIDKNQMQGELLDFVKHYKYYFPGKVEPHFVTYISAFNYANITTDSIVGIGLDFYLGSDCKFYPSLQFPQYVTGKLNKENITVNCIGAWYQKLWEQDVTKNVCLEYMIYEGKKLYFTDAMSPKLSDAIKIGYTNEQWKWAEKYEKDNWAAFIENKLLFDNDYKKFIKLVSDGPNSPGFALESAPKLGAYFGWKIVKAYMEKNKSITLSQLMIEQDAQKILEMSKYKP